MSPVTRTPCPHDIGPGTSVCLRCRQEERQRALVHQKRVMMRIGAGLAGLAVVAVLGNAVVSALGASSRRSDKEPMHLLASTAGSAVRQQGSPVPADTVARMPVAAIAPVKPASTVKPGPGLTLSVPLGRTDLRDSVYVEREGDSAVVHFDTEAARTRRRDKFEAVVRTTLPALYGARARSMLEALPDGGIVGDRDLLNDVAVHGARLEIPDGGTLELRPVTRPGRDGPLVVGYRTRVTP